MQIFILERKTWKTSGEIDKLNAKMLAKSETNMFDLENLPETYETYPAERSVPTGNFYVNGQKIDNEEYFGGGYPYTDYYYDIEKFCFFCKAVLSVLPSLGFRPDIIHCNDWQTGMVPALLKIQYAHFPFYAGIKTIYTIHNLQYQGIFGIKEVQDVLGLGDSLWTNDKLECFGCANYLKAGLVYADIITTVSPSYAEEIQTAYYGERLDGLLRARKHEVYGILNGLDVVDYDPATDDAIAAKFSADDLSGKAACKAALQQEMNLTVDPDIPIIGMVGRLSNQKGLDLVDCVMSDMMGKNVQLVVLGMGESRYVNLFEWAQKAFEGRIACRFDMNSDLAHRIYAGCDMFLMPSQFEPCGLRQMIAMRYGTIPVVRETGGLKDTVQQFDKYTQTGNGFVFNDYNAHEMMYSLKRALSAYENPEEWRQIVDNAMRSDYSWAESAKEYKQLYEKLTAR